MYKTTNDNILIIILFKRDYRAEYYKNKRIQGYYYEKIVSLLTIIFITLSKPRKVAYRAIKRHINIYDK